MSAEVSAQLCGMRTCLLLLELLAVIVLRHGRIYSDSVARHSLNCGGMVREAVGDKESETVSGLLLVEVITRHSLHGVSIISGDVKGHKVCEVVHAYPFALPLFPLKGLDQHLICLLLLSLRHPAAPHIHKLIACMLGEEVLLFHLQHNLSFFRSSQCAESMFAFCDYLCGRGGPIYNCLATIHFNLSYIVQKSMKKIGIWRHPA